ncbi:MAG TPA: hypothetical protein VJ179_00615 [Patescibacteria group bacterium]|nr:hypothetical protein [Patescibacteria group bacterium]
MKQKRTSILVNPFSFLKNSVLHPLSLFLSVYKKSLLVVVVILVLIVLSYGVYKVVRPLAFAGYVNGQYIPRYQVISRLENTYGEQFFEAIVQERLVSQEAKKRGLAVTKEENDQRYEKLAEEFGGKESFESFLSQRKISKQELSRQIDIEILVEKLFGSTISISDGDVDTYFKDNVATEKEATYSAEEKEQIREELKRQKLGEAFETWVKEARDASRVEYYLK